MQRDPGTRNDARRRRAWQLAAAAVAWAACAATASAQTTVWDVGSGVTPDQAELPWTLTDTASPEDPVLDGTPALTLATSADAETMTYGHAPPALQIPPLLVIEARMRVTSNVSSSSAARAANISFTIAPDFGNTLFIGADEIFLLADFNEKGPSAVVDTDAFHDYEIFVDNVGNVAVYLDGIEVLTGLAIVDSSVNGPTPRVEWGMASTRAHGSTQWQHFEHNAGPPITLAQWGTAFAFQGSSGSLNPAVLVGFNPQPEPPGVDLSNSFKPVISTTGLLPSEPVVQLNLVAFGVSQFPPDRVIVGNRFEFDLVDGSGPFTLALEFSTSSGALLDPASLVGFNPQPEPPGSDIYGFNPQPEPPGSAALKGLLFETIAGGGGAGADAGPVTISVSVEILDGVGTPMPVALVPVIVPALGPLGRVAAVLVLLAAAVGSLRLRRHAAQR